MASLIEFHGRLFRVGSSVEPVRTAQGRRIERTADPGLYDLRIALHAGRDDSVALWSEAHDDVPVAVGGFFGVVLGEREPVPAGLFDGTPRWLSATGLGDNLDVLSARVPLLGHAVRVYEQLTALTARVNDLEALLVRSARRETNLNRRLKRIEQGKGVLAGIISRATSLDTRVTRLDGTEGRVTRLEDEVEDVVGPDGDLIDIIERLERIEGVRPGKASVDPKAVEDLGRRLDELAERVKTVARSKK